MVSHPQVLATISTGGAAKCVSVPPIDTDRNSSPKVAYFNLFEGENSKNFDISSDAEIVIAAGSVMNEPSTEPMQIVETHQAPTVPPPIPAIFFIAHEAESTIGLLADMSIIVITNRGSPNLCSS